MSLAEAIGERLISLDTNVLVHSAIKNADYRHPIANEIVGALSDKECVLSTQSLTELFNVISKKVQFGVEGATSMVEELMASFTIVRPSPSGVRAAMHLVKQGSLSIHDAMLLVTLSWAGCRFFLTEDRKLVRIRKYGITRIINPYSEGFDLQSLLDEAAELAQAALEVPPNELFGVSRNRSASAVPHRLVLPFSPELIRAVIPFLKTELRKPGEKPGPGRDEDGDDGPGDACITIEF